MVTAEMFVNPIAGQETTRISTSRFGEIEVNVSQFITFPEGLLGFEEVTEFCVLPYGPDSPFYWLQSVHMPDLAFILINPFDFYTDYDFEISDADMEQLALTSAEETIVFAVVTVSDQLTANLVGPVVVNASNRLAKQVVLTDGRYDTRHVLKCG